MKKLTDKIKKEVEFVERYKWFMRIIVHPIQFQHKRKRRQIIFFKYEGIKKRYEKTIT